MRLQQTDIKTRFPQLLTFIPYSNFSCTANVGYVYIDNFTCAAFRLGE